MGIMKSLHRHRPRKHTWDPTYFRGCVVGEGDGCVPLAHGGRLELQACSCGADRLVNVNRGIYEIGDWTDGVSVLSVDFMEGGGEDREDLEYDVKAA